MARPKSIDENSVALDGNKLRTLIREHNLRQWWLAEQLGISKRTLVRWTNNDSTFVKPAHLKKLAELVHAREEDLTAFSSSNSSSLVTARDLQVLENTLFRNGQWDVLEKTLSSLETDPDDPISIAAWHRLTGITKFRLGKLEDAARHIKTAVETLPSNTEVDIKARYLMNLALMDRDLDSLPEMIEKLSALAPEIQSNELRAMIYNNLGISSVRLDNYAQASEFQKKALAICRDNVSITPALFIETIINHAQTLLDLNDASKADELIEQGISISLRHDLVHLTAHLKLFKAHRLVNKNLNESKALLEESVSIMNRVSAGAPPPPFALIVSGEIELKEGRKARAKELFERALTHAKSDFEQANYRKFLNKLNLDFSFH